MGKISNEAKDIYIDKIKIFKGEIEALLAKEKKLLAASKASSEKAPYYRVSLADETLNVVSYYLLMNTLSMHFLGVKNDAYLNNARKACYKSLIYLEETVSKYIDVPFSEYEERLQKIARLKVSDRARLIRKIGYSIQSVKEAYGQNTKWKWAFIEIEGRYAAVTKNFLNLKTVIAGIDPRADGYEHRLYHLSLTKKLLQNSADGYRQKYELSTNRRDDFMLAINFLGALRRLHSVLGEADQAEIVRKKAEIWKSKMDADQKKRS